MNRDDAFAAARASLWLGQYGTGFQNAVLSHARLLTFGKGEYVMHISDPSHDIYFLAEGIVLFSVAHPVMGLINGQAVHPGRWFGEAAGMSRRTRLVGAEVRRRATVLAIPVAAIHHVMQEKPEHMVAVLSLMASSSEDYMLHSVDLMIQSPRARLCSRLMTLAGRRLDAMPPKTIGIPMSQEELAMASCMSRQTVNQVLNELVDLGICELRYGEIRVLDTGALAAQIG
jgi:CRP/FNR family transcriptional regulator, cyclic AMP receptor protein